MFSSLSIFPSGYLGLKAAEQAGNGVNRFGCETERPKKTFKKNCGSVLSKWKAVVTAFRVWEAGSCERAR